MYGARLGLVSGAHTKARHHRVRCSVMALAYQNPCSGKGSVAVAILPHNGPDAGSDDPAVDLKRTLLTNVSSFKSASKTNAWIDEMMALREDAKEPDSIGFCSRIFTQLSLPYRDPGASGAITWVRQNGAMRLQLNPLLDIDADGQALPAFPYGKYPRLLYSSFSPFISPPPTPRPLV